MPVRKPKIKSPFRYAFIHYPSQEVFKKIRPDTFPGMVSACDIKKRHFFTGTN